MRHMGTLHREEVGVQSNRVMSRCDFACMLLHRAAVKAWNSTFGL